MGLRTSIVTGGLFVIAFTLSGCSDDEGSQRVLPGDVMVRDAGFDAVDTFQGHDTGDLDLSSGGGDGDADDIRTGPKPIDEIREYGADSLVGTGDYAFSVAIKANDDALIDLMVSRLTDEGLSRRVAYLDFWGQAQSLALEGERVAVPINRFRDDPPSVMLVDIGDPLQPVLLASPSLEPMALSVSSWDCFNPRDIAFVGDQIYVPCRSGLVVYDVSDPERPRLQTPPVRRSWRGALIAVSPSLGANGQRLALVSSFATLHVLDVADPTNVVEHFTADDEDGPIRDLFTDGTHAFVSHEGVLKIWDLENPAEPVQVASLEADSWIKSINLVDDHLFFLEETYFDHDLGMRIPGYVRIYDIADRANPIYRCSIASDELPHTANTILDAYVNDGFIYMSVDTSAWAEAGAIRRLALADLFAGPCAAADGPGD